MAEYQDLDKVTKDGGPAVVSDEVLASLKDAIDTIRSDCTTYVTDRRLLNENTRYCVWEGQSPDGRKRKQFLGTDPLPFDGASDNRVRLSDKYINLFVKQCVAAARRAEPKVTGTDGADIAQASKVGIMLRYVINNLWRNDYRKQLELLANYMFGDSPASAVAYVDWMYEEAMEYRTLKAEDALMELVNNAVQQAAAMGQAEDQIVIEQIMQEAQLLFQDPARAEELAGALAMILPDVKPARLVKVAKDLQAQGIAQYPARYTKSNKPVMKALRLYEDIFVPINITDIQRSPVVFKREWYTRAEILERGAVEGWSDSFVRKLLYGDHQDEQGCGAEGQSGFDDYTTTGPNRNLNTPVDNRRGLYEIIRCYTRSANEDGVIGIYLYTISHFVDEAAKDRELWDRKHGNYPFVFFNRENITSRLSDSRGVPELMATDQAGMKLLKDSFEDHVQVTINPPIIKPRNRPFFNLNRAPFGMIDADARDRVQFLEPNQYPATADKYWVEMRREIAEYWGVFDAEVNQNQVITSLYDQDRVDNFLSSLADALGMTVQLCQQYFDDATMQRIVGGNGLPVVRSIEEIQGSFDIHVTFDVRDLDLEKLIQKAEVTLKYIRPLDTNGEIPVAPFLRQVVAALDPNWAETIPPADVSSQRIIKEEKANCVTMLNGIEPDMPEVIEAPQVRLQVLQETLSPMIENPQSFAPISPASQMIIQNRMKYLQFQADQIANADIGRTGAEPVPQEELAASGQEVAQ